MQAPAMQAAGVSAHTMPYGPALRRIAKTDEKTTAFRRPESRSGCEPNLSRPSKFTHESTTMTTQNKITPELQAKIDALEDETLKKDIIFLLSGPGKRIATNEEIFNNRVASYEKAKAQRALWRQWRDDEVLAFVEHFKQEMPEDYAEFLRQEHDNNEIEDETWWKAERLAERTYGELSGVDRSSLLGKVRDHLKAQSRAGQGNR
jgi:hypothetical protein